MDDLDDLRASEFVTDTEDQDSLDERIDSEQRLRNQQLWLSFQNVACCITKLYKDRTQPNLSPWIPFQNAASNLTTLYKDCIESQRRFARIGYQVGRRKRMRDLTKLLKKHKLQTKQQQAHQPNIDHADNSVNTSDSTTSEDVSPTTGHQENVQHRHHSAVASILAVNQLNLDCDESLSNSMQAQNSNQLHLQATHQDQSSFQQFQHVSPKKRSCPSIGGNPIKRVRE